MTKPGKAIFRRVFGPGRFRFARRAIGVTVRRAKIRLRIFIPTQNYRKLIQGPDQVFLACLQIARAVNAIRYSERCYLRATGTGRFEEEKDRVESILLLAARLFEATETYAKYRRAFTTTRTYKRHLNQFRLLTRDSHFRRLLRDIRRKVLFHFDADVLTDVMNQFVDKDPITFGAGESGRNKDLVYSLLDDFAITYIAGRMSETAHEAAWEEFTSDLLVWSERFCSLMNHALGELLFGYVGARADRVRL